MSSSEEKLLGVQIDHAISWNAQVQKQKKTIIFKLFLLKRIRKFLPLETRKLFFITIMSNPILNM